MATYQGNGPLAGLTFETGKELGQLISRLEGAPKEWLTQRDCNDDTYIYDLAIWLLGMRKTRPTLKGGQHPTPSRRNRAKSIAASVLYEAEKVAEERKQLA